MSPAPTTPGAVAPHAGATAQRTSPELSDIALFAMAVACVILVRRSLRARFAKRRGQNAPKD
ncbi:MAG: hypothetical protein K2P68_04510 [Sphingomonas sp.]|nr:hypothetical protein [Sphingomonas sp.]